MFYAHNLEFQTLNNHVKIGQFITEQIQEHFVRITFLDFFVHGEEFDINEKECVCYFQHHTQDIPKLFMESLDELVESIILTRYPKFVPARAESIVTI